MTSAPRLFLSYARADEPKPFDPTTSFVARLQRDLEQRGFDVWFDRVSLPSRRLTFHQEIREAISERDKLLLVIGPSAVNSEYVRQEWRFALEADKVVVPILRAGDHSLLAGELAKPHCEDFREDSQYEFHLNNLARILSDPPPTLGRLRSVPSLPPHYIYPVAQVEAIRNALRADLDRPVVTTGALMRVGLHGMGGIGKSMLAALLARERSIREAFPDGICWVGVGKGADVLELQRQVHRDLGGDGALADADEGRNRLREILEDKAVLLILDDAWRRADVDAFDILGPRCRALITSRDHGLLSSLGAQCFGLDLLTDSEARELLAQTVGATVEELPDEADHVLQRCGRLPLAVALCGGMIRTDTPWHDLRDALQEHDLEFVSDGHRASESHTDLWKAMEVSVLKMPEPDRERFADLAVFSNAAPVPEAAVLTLWRHKGALRERHARQTLLRFKKRSLVQIDQGAMGGPVFVSLHALVYSLAVRRAQGEDGSLVHLHQAMLNAYAGECKRGWSSGPNDGYFLTHLREHLVAANRGSELADLVCDLRWLELKNSAGLVFDLPADYEAAQEAIDGTNSNKAILGLLSESLQRELHFIHRHRQDYPQALFQCMWNTCWWHDCAERSKHLVRPTSVPGGPNPAGPASMLLEEWREQRQAREPGFRWVRDLRPHPLPLGSGQLQACRGHTARINRVAISTDGSLAGTASEDRTARIWDLATGYEVHCLRGHERPVHGIALAPGAPIAATSSSDRTVRLWSTKTGKELHRIVAHSGTVWAVGFSPDGSRLASCSGDGTLRIWDSATAEAIEVISPKSALTGIPERVVGDTTIYLDGDHVQDLFERQGPNKANPGAPVYCLVWSPTGRFLAFGGADRCLRVYDTRNWNEAACLTGHANWVMELDWSPDEECLVSGSHDGTVRSWNWPGRRAKAVEYRPGSRIRTVRFTADALAIATSFDEVTLRFLDRRGLAERPMTVRHNDVVTCVAFATDPPRMATASEDGILRLWEIPVDTPHRGADPCNHQAPCTDLALSPDENSIATSSADNTIRIWDLDGIERFCLIGHQHTVDRIAFSPDGQRIASASGDTTMRVWSLKNGAEIARASDCDKTTLRLVFGRTGRWIFAHEQHGVRVWRDDGTPAALIPDPTARTVYHTAVSDEDGMIAIVTHLAAEVKMWNAQKGDYQILFAKDKSITGWLFEVWDVNPPKMRVRTPAPEGLGAVAFSPYNHYLAFGFTYCSDRDIHNIQLWKLLPDRAGIEPSVLSGHANPVAELRFSADAALLGSRDEAGVVKLWDVETAECLAVWQGATDLAAVVGGAERFPSLALSRGEEIRIVLAESGDTVGWYPAAQHKLVSCSSAQRWFGVSGCNVSVLQLEGAHDERCDCGRSARAP